ncbi:hypothetical protein Mal15_56950 [Stieleria maiorica]|uniref:Uncharacterized protein n=1 Tax=Stieleria maiorica TaxID=2795974 RepID=A0A5B9MNW8_9BACT|nr:hypothetical protein Mal15_56950 [Stieleria maiorica]
MRNENPSILGRKDPPPLAVFRLNRDGVPPRTDLARRIAKIVPQEWLKRYNRRIGLGSFCRFLLQPPSIARRPALVGAPPKRDLRLLRFHFHPMFECLE